MKIGRVALLAQVAVDTVRYYERIGLIRATRGASGYREFEDSAVERIGLVKQLQELGLTLQEIAELFAAATCSGRSCATESTRLEAALRRTDEKIATLTAARGKLDEALARCRGGECDLLDRAANTDAARGSRQRLSRRTPSPSG
jgi:MerR family transcriptional regulator, copper efflux regulator